MVKKLGIDTIGEIKKLFSDVFSNEPWNDEWHSDEQLTRYIMELIGNNNSLSLGYYQDSKLIGLSLGYILHWWEGKELFIKEFCIDRNYQHKGYGKRFLKEMEDLLLKDGIKMIWLSTDRKFPAYKFYLGNGFEESSENILLGKTLEV